MPYKNPENQKHNIARWTKENHAHKLSYMRQYRLDNLEWVTAAQKKWIHENPEKAAASKKKWAAKNPEKRRLINEKYRTTHSVRLRREDNERMRVRRESDENFKILGALRCRLYSSVKKAGVKKAARTFALIGCDLQFLRGYLEARFQFGMTWANYGKGKGKWHIDHHIPCAEFDLRNPEQQRQCFNYTNLRPMWEPENQSKGAKRPPTHQAELI